jgi:bifunctional N-acetylglucosamine-1-phosphate-uridyltransferase/glucosamine-1-phosphate-acetyltransferase GlmU-like protein
VRREQLPQVTGEYDQEDNRHRLAAREGDVSAVRTVPLLAYGVSDRAALAVKRQTPRKRRRRRLLVTTVTLDRPIAAAA